VGQFFDYFAAANAEVASLAIASGPHACGFDPVEAKGIAPDVVLSQLVAFIVGTPSSAHISATRLLWPPAETEPTRKAYDGLPEGSPLRDGPYLQELDARTREALASVDDALLPGLAAQWARIEEMSALWDESSLRQLLAELVDLARTAQKAGDQLYCWSTL
jgi:hypothetical protein